MLKSWPTLMFPIIASLASLIAFFISLVLATVLMPPDILYQLTIFLPVFFLLSAVLTLQITKITLATNDRPIKSIKNRVIWGTATLNLALALTTGALIYSGFTTAAEALAILVILMVLGFAGLKALILAHRAN